MDIRDKAVTRMGKNNGSMVSLPSMWMKAKQSPNRICMVVGNILIIAAEDEKELVAKAASQLMEAGIMDNLGLEGFEEVVR